MQESRLKRNRLEEAGENHERISGISNIVISSWKCQNGDFVMHHVD